MSHADEKPVDDMAEQICTCYLGDPDDPTRDEEACAACDYEYWQNPVAVDAGFYANRKGEQP